ncbi:MAG: hypothetical protein K6E17_03600, partial [Clostridiales bacterium]|nr:hypothetical protein [Clostridiales bacterium]
VYYRKNLTVTADDKTKVYGVADPTLTATVDGIVTTLDTEAAVRSALNLQLSRAEGENVGDYAISITGETVLEHYVVSYTGNTFHITPKPVTLKADELSKVYGSDDPTLTAVPDGLVGEDTLNYTLARAEGENVGDYDITVTLGSNPNYTVTETGNVFHITPKPVTLKADELSKVYGSEDPTLTAVPDGLVGEDTLNYTLVRAEGENVGDYAIAITLGSNPNYTVTETGNTFHITPKPVTLKADELSKVYGSEDPTLTAVPDGLVGEDTLNYTLVRAEGENVGDYAITVTLGSNPNYTVTETGNTFHITPLAITITADDKTKTYDNDETTDPELTATVTGAIEGDEVNYTLAREEGQNAGEYTITVTNGENPNYTVTVEDGTFTIETLNTVVVTITEHSGRFVYDAENHTVSGYDVAISDPLYTEADFRFIGTASVTAKDVGTYSMNLTPANFANTNANFDNVTFVIEEGEMVITPKTVTVTADNKTMTYGDEEPVLSAKVEGLAGNDSLAVTLNREDGKNAGTYTITPAVVPNGNYTVTIVPGTLTIEPKTVIVAANDQAKIYGEDDPELTATVIGLVAGESEDLITYTLNREDGDEAGTYTITAAGETAQGNYTVTYADGGFTIAPEGSTIVRIAANNGSFKYDGEEKDLSGYTIAISNDLYTADDFEFTGSSELKGTNAGVYTTEMSAADFRNTSANFENVIFLVENGRLEITKRQITMTSGDASKAYDGTALTNGNMEITGEGFVEGEEPIITVTGRITREGTADNTFTWTMPAGASKDNYEVDEVYGTLTITASQVYSLRIHYVYEDGTEFDSFAKDYATGESYNIASPKVAGYEPDFARTTGTMGTEDVELTVKYREVMYTLTVEFTSTADDSQVMMSIVSQFKAGAEYHISVPTVDGYTPMKNEIVGTMPANDLEITVFMIPDEEYERMTSEGVRHYDYITIKEYGTALGITNSVLGSGEIIE